MSSSTCGDENIISLWGPGKNRRKLANNFTLKEDLHRRCGRRPSEGKNKAKQHVRLKLDLWKPRALRVTASQFCYSSTSLRKVLRGDFAHFPRLVACGITPDGIERWDQQILDRCMKSTLCKLYLHTDRCFLLRLTWITAVSENLDTRPLLGAFWPGWI